MNICVVCNRKIRPWWYLYRAASIVVDDFFVSVCRKQCYITLASAIEAQLAFIYLSTET